MVNGLTEILAIREIRAPLPHRLRSNLGRGGSPNGLCISDRLILGCLRGTYSGEVEIILGSDVRPIPHMRRLVLYTAFASLQEYTMT